MRLIIGISGASGVIYGIRLLEMLQAFEEVETHLVLSRYGRLNIELETDYPVNAVEALADVVHTAQSPGPGCAYAPASTNRPRL